MIRLFPKMDFGEFAVEPAVADDAMLRWIFAGEIIRLRSAGDGGKRGLDGGDGATATELRDARRMFADERLGEADDVDDGKAIHIRDFNSRMAAATIFRFIS